MGSITSTDSYDLTSDRLVFEVGDVDANGGYVEILPVIAPKSSSTLTGFRFTSSTVYCIYLGGSIYSTTAYSTSDYNLYYLSLSGNTLTWGAVVAGTDHVLTTQTISDDEVLGHKSVRLFARSAGVSGGSIVLGSINPTIPQSNTGSFIPFFI